MAYPSKSSSSKAVPFPGVGSTGVDVVSGPVGSVVVVVCVVGADVEFDVGETLVSGATVESGGATDVPGCGVTPEEDAGVGLTGVALGVTGLPVDGAVTGVGPAVAPVGPEVLGPAVVEAVGPGIEAVGTTEEVGPGPMASSPPSSLAHA